MYNFAKQNQTFYLMKKHVFICLIVQTAIVFALRFCFSIFTISEKMLVCGCACSVIYNAILFVNIVFDNYEDNHWIEHCVKKNYIIELTSLFLISSVTALAGWCLTNYLFFFTGFFVCWFIVVLIEWIIVTKEKKHINLK